jgi:hypothetical protein
MRIPDAKLDEVRERGFTVVEDFLSGDELAAAREALWLHYPRPEEYFTDPEKYPDFGRSQFSGLYLFPYKSWHLNRLAFHPDLVDAAERLLGSADLELYKVELWGKYAGAIDYDQAHHYDYGNHSLVVPRADGRFRQMTTFLLLSDVTELDGPTKVLPLDLTRDIPYVPRVLPMGEMFDREVAATGPAGSLLIYHTGVLHRGSNFAALGRSRFALLADYQARGAPWAGKMSWPGRALDPNMTEVFLRASPRERDLFGWPPPGHEYWNEQTLAGVAARYPGIDLTPYRVASTVPAD